MFALTPTRLAGVLAVRPTCREDPRGRFVKTLHAEAFTAAGLRADFRESYFSTSTRHVLRGLHFQTPPADHDKLVYCASGRVFDVVVDLRRSSPTYGACETFVLDGREAAGLYVPTGCAHGFLTLSAEAMLLYFVTSVHAPAHDAGIRWDSVDVAWPARDPILSDRDRAFPALAAFDTPFP